MVVDYIHILTHGYYLTPLHIIVHMDYIHVAFYTILYNTKYKYMYMYSLLSVICCSFLINLFYLIVILTINRYRQLC